MRAHLSHLSCRSDHHPKNIDAINFRFTGLYLGWYGARCGRARSEDTVSFSDLETPKWSFKARQVNQGEWSGAAAEQTIKSLRNCFRLLAGLAPALLAGCSERWSDGAGLHQARPRTSQPLGPVLSSSVAKWKCGQGSAELGCLCRLLLTLSKDALKLQ